MKGYIHLYTGDGKGKTTASVGLALRAMGRGRKVTFVQFLKGSESGEILALMQLPSIRVLRNSKDYGFFPSMNKQEREEVFLEHTANLREALLWVQQGACDFLILDEVTAAYTLGALDRSLVDELLRHKPDALELVLTGRDPPEIFLAAADYISDIRKIKHPFDNGQCAREGIEY